MADEPTTDAPAPTDAPPDPSDDLGDAGKKALDEERKARKAAEKAVKDLQAELDKVRTAAMSEQERAIAQARLEGAQEARSSANERLIRAEARAAATGKLADPNDVFGFLDLSQFTVADDGSVDDKAISSAIDELLKNKPYLAASATRPTGSADQGTRHTAPAAPDMDSLLRAAVNGRK